MAADLFWSKVAKGWEDSCWLWQAAKSSHGYGQFWYQGKTVAAHRVALILSGVTLGDSVVMHACDVKLCCNPAHLSLGTLALNNADRDAKGRGYAGKRHLNSQKTHCPEGHPYSPTNTYLRPNGSRDCRLCMATASREYRRRRAR